MPEIRLANLEEYSNISSFINQHWKKNHTYTRSKELFDWTFRDNPAWNELGYSISIAIESDSIVGMLGTIPFELNVYGQNFRACWLVNWLLIPEARKGRVGLNLLNLFSKNYGYDTISFGINDTIARLYAALKWQYMPAIPRMVWINSKNIENAEKLLIETNPNINITEIREYISKHKTTLKEINSTSINPIDQIKSGDWDNNGWENWRYKTVGCSRDAKYLKWRYFEHPIYQYETRMIADGANIGLIIWRVETTSKANLNGQLEEYFPIARIVEFLPISDSNALDLMSEFIKHSDTLGVIAADFYCYNEEICQILNRIGFLTSNIHTGVVLPNYTQPLANGGDIRSAIYLAQGHKIDANAPAWYWTRSDSDQDRPN